MDCVCVSQRPRKGHIKPLKCLNYMTSSFNDILLTILRLQIDNQLFRKGLYDFPTVVSGQQQSLLQKFRFNNCIASNFMIEMLKESSLVSLALTFDANGHDGSVLKSVRMNIQPLTVFIEDTFAFKLNAIMNSFDSFDKRHSIQDKTSSYSKLPKDVLIASQNLARHLSLDLLKIEEMSVLVNVHASMKMYIGLDQSPLHFSTFERSNITTTSYALGMYLRYFSKGAWLYV